MKSNLLPNAIAVLFCIFQITSCNSNPLIGKWETTISGATATIEFLPDGTVIEPLGTTANYEVIDNQRIKFTWLGISAVEEYSLDGGVLSFRGATWKRRKN